jgi:DNA-binding MarR family transcriptional regulator
MNNQTLDLISEGEVWDDAAYYAEILEALMRRFARAFARLDREEICCCGCTPAQCATVSAIAESARPVAMTELSNRLGLAVSTVTRCLDRLAHMGLVARSEHPTDRRVTLVDLTDAGLAKLDQIKAADRRFFAQVIGRMPTEERQNLIRAFEALLKALPRPSEPVDYNPCC